MDKYSTSVNKDETFKKSYIVGKTCSVGKAAPSLMVEVESCIFQLRVQQ